MKRTTKQRESSTATSDEYPQTGAPISREAWLGVWPVSKRGNEWVRAFDATYTLKAVDNGPPFANWTEMSLTVVGPGGVRVDKHYEKLETELEVKELLWPAGRAAPYTLDDLQANVPELGA